MILESAHQRDLIDNQCGRSDLGWPDGLWAYYILRVKTVQISLANQMQLA